jgi:hypothetical protein
MNYKKSWRADDGNKTAKSNRLALSYPASFTAIQMHFNTTSNEYVLRTFTHSK